MTDQKQGVRLFSEALMGNTIRSEPTTLADLAPPALPVKITVQGPYKSAWAAAAAEADLLHFAPMEYHRYPPTVPSADEVLARWREESKTK